MSAPRALYLRRHPVTFLIFAQAAIGGLYLAITGEANAGSASLHQFAHPYGDVAWPVLYAIGGMLGVRGVLKTHPPCEVAGSVLVAFTLSFYAIALVAVFGLDSTFISASLCAGVAAGMILRSLSIIYRGRN